MTENLNELKRQAAEKAVESVSDGMIVGLGTGSTAKLAVEAIGRRMRDDGLRIRGIPTSEATEAQAKSLNIPLVDLGSVERIDLTIDGADAVEPGSLTLIKGLGGALLREKIVASFSRQMIVIVDDSKLAGALGTFTPVPVEITRFAWQATQRRLMEFSGVAPLRQGKDGAPFITDGGNFILDCQFGAIADAPHLEARIAGIPGVVETGLFIGMATKIIVAGADGVRILERR